MSPCMGRTRLIDFKSHFAQIHAEMPSSKTSRLLSCSLNSWCISKGWWTLHQTVNHSRHFVDLITGAQIQNVESAWNRMKIRLKSAKGCRREYLQAFLNEHMWFNWKAGNDAFVSICREIHARFPVYSTIRRCSIVYFISRTPLIVQFHNLTTRLGEE